MSSNNLSQFVSRVVSFTSEYGEHSWQASNLIGPPTSNMTYGDNSSAWCPAQADQNQILELAFDTDVFISKIRLYENYNGGACTRLEALNQASGEYELLWSASHEHFVSASGRVCNYYLIFEPQFEMTSFKSNQVRVTLALESRAALFCEIEAVELVGSLINVTVPKNKLALDLSHMFLESSYFDCEIRVGDELETIKSHKCILAMRAKELFMFLVANDFHLRDENIQLEKVKFLFEFIYTDELDESKLERLIEAAKLTENANNNQNLTTSPNENNDDCLDYKSTRVKWMLVVNDLIRGAIRFGLARLEKLLILYLIDKFLSVSNVLYVLMDALDENRCCVTGSLPLVEEVCLSFTKIHVKQVIKLDEFKLLPKNVLLKIVLKL